MIVSTESVELYVDTLLGDPGPHFSVSAVANRQVSHRHRFGAADNGYSQCQRGGEPSTLSPLA